MADYLLHFDDEASCDLPDGEGSCWEAGGLTVMPVSVTTVEAVWSDGEEPEQLAPAVLADGYWLVVSADGPFSNAAIVSWAQCPGRVSPTFAGRDYPTS